MTENRHDRRMAKRFEAKKQHYVAKGYMEAWFDVNKAEHEHPFVWVFSKNADEQWGPGKRRSPKKLFRETDMYTRIADNGDQRDISIETTLSKIEADFCLVRRKYIEPTAPLDGYAIAILAAFVAAAQSRTPRARENVIRQWTPVLTAMENLQTHMSSLPVEERNRAGRSMRSNGKQESMTIEDVKELVEAPLQSTVLSHVRVLMPLLAKLNLSIFCTKSSPGFIASDEPCVWYDPESYKRPPMHRGPALRYKSLEITLPLSPTRLLFWSHQDYPEYFDLDQHDFNETLVNEINRRTCGFADKSVIVNKNEFRPIWAEHGKPPV